MFEVITAIQTDGANYELSNEDIVKKMRELFSKQPFKLTGIGFDFLAGKFLSPVKEPGKLANLFLKLCPEIGDKKTAAIQLRQNSELFLWWD